MGAAAKRLLPDHRSGTPAQSGWLLVLLLGGLLLPGCAPTYRPDQLLQAIQTICANEHRFQVTARQAGHTIAIHLSHEGVLTQEGGQITLDPSANEVLGDLIEAIHRVILSSNAKIDFYLVLVSDPKVPGAYLTMVRYVEDVRRANANMLPPTEFFLRTIFELKYVGVPVTTIDQLILSDIKLGQFLSWQLAKRIQARLADALRQRGMLSVDVGPCAGEFHNGEFTFTLNVAPPNAETQLTDAQVQEIFSDASSVIAQVLSGYDFKDFDHVRLVHPPTGRSILLPKARLQLLR